MTFEASSLLTLPFAWGDIGGAGIIFSKMCFIKAKKAESSVHQQAHSGTTILSLVERHKPFWNRLSLLCLLSCPWSTTSSTIQDIISECENGSLDYLDNSAPYMFAGTTYGPAQEDLAATVSLSLNSAVLRFDVSQTSVTILGNGRGGGPLATRYTVDIPLEKRLVLNKRNLC
ncbi:hypothetical protein ARMGADRAFT_1090144 [Armillaria gallica]|uniref:Uncharacterized protein n=1 Tax=Armillaria gallica TaxID=47427 RepID=A0A2H3CW66_ARMGA|nr:hypothetical protein ARMGADRAFT_1090144 [Armillaria gallica]